jgi:hypothetical protein
MALQLQLFRGDPKLDAAAVSDSAHIVLADQLTQAYENADSQIQPQSGRIKVALVSGSSPHATHELQAMLHNRLRIITLIWVVFLAVSLAFEFVRCEPRPDMRKAPQ